MKKIFGVLGVAALVGLVGMGPAPAAAAQTLPNCEEELNGPGVTEDCRDVGDPGTETGDPRWWSMIAEEPDVAPAPSDEPAR